MQNLGFKFRFKLQSRYGPLVDGVMINALDEAEAARKLYQVYPSCHILETKIVKIISSQVNKNLANKSLHKSEAAITNSPLKVRILNTSNNLLTKANVQQFATVNTNTINNFEFEEIIDMISK